LPFLFGKTPGLPAVSLHPGNHFTIRAIKINDRKCQRIAALQLKYVKLLAIKDNGFDKRGRGSFLAPRLLALGQLD
jgi:hypothetical protein